MKAPFIKAAGIQLKRLNCPVRSIENYNHDTRRVLLEIPEEPGNKMAFKAGQYLEMVLPGKNCPFSIASSPDCKDVIELHIRPTPDSEDSLEVEALLDSGVKHIQIEFPKGDCIIEEAPPNPLILLAAGTGVTQMNSIIEFLLPRGMSQPVYLYWGVLADKDLYLDEHYHELVIRHENFHYTPVVSEPDSSPRWRGRTGLVPHAVLEDFEDLTDVTVYVGGGPGMVYATLDSFMASGLPEDRMFSDVFSYAPRSKEAVQE
jgi:NAD(P)H-flavin reductase